MNEGDKLKKGNSVITLPILLIFSIIVISCISVMLINILKPYVMYEKLLSTTLRYMFVLEEYGYLTQADKDSLIQELVSQGFNRENLDIQATQRLQEYGDTVYLSITYNHIVDLPTILEGTLSIDNKKRTTTMNVTKYGISKI